MLSMAIVAAGLVRQGCSEHRNFFMAHFGVCSVTAGLSGSKKTRLPATGTGCPAAAGYGLLWTALLSLPLMISVQMMCGRLGMVTGRGLAGVIRRRYSRWVLWGACLLLVVANVINIAADLGGMGQGAELVTGVSSLIWTPLFTVTITGFMFRSSYRQIARIFKWLTLVLLAYVGTAFLAHVDWRVAIMATFLPHIAWSREYFSLLLGILGTTISPYLFFWQASQEVEEERSMGRNLAQRQGATDGEMRRLRTDTMTGMFASNLIMYFIILTTATLHAHGTTDIQTARQAAEALRPLAGQAAYWDSDVVSVRDLVEATADQPSGGLFFYYRSKVTFLCKRRYLFSCAGSATVHKKHGLPLGWTLAGWIIALIWALAAIANASC